MNVKINENFDNLSENYLFSEINKRINKYKEENIDADIIKLGIGDVTLPLGNTVIEALIKASNEMGNKDTFRGYPPEYGYDFMKEAVKKYYKRFNVNLDLDSIFISDGAKSDLGNIVDIFGNNNIYIPNPVYPVYLDSNLMSGRNINFINGTKENNFLPLPTSDIKKGSIIYLCSPNNPTGSSYKYDELKKWVDFALNNDSLIIYDSAYEAFISSVEYPHSIYEIEGAKTCAIEICSFSKQAGFTGLRCGFTIIPLEIVCSNHQINKLWKRRQATKFNGVSYPVQRAAEAALTDKGIKECMQLVCIEYARNVIGYKDANSGEFDKNTKHNVIDYLDNQYDGINMGGTLRLGLYDCHLIDTNTKTYKAYQKTDIRERHRHRYEFNNNFLEVLGKDLIITGKNLKGNLVEIVELKNHPWYVACQFHPEFLSRPQRPHPLFRDFIEAAINSKK